MLRTEPLLMVNRSEQFVETTLSVSDFKHMDETLTFLSLRQLISRQLCVIINLVKLALHQYNQQPSYTACHFQLSNGLLSSMNQA